MASELEERKRLGGEILWAIGKEKVDDRTSMTLKVIAMEENSEGMQGLQRRYEYELEVQEMTGRLPGTRDGRMIIGWPKEGQASVRAILSSMLRESRYWLEHGGARINVVALIPDGEYLLFIMEARGSARIRELDRGSAPLIQLISSTLLWISARYRADPDADKMLLYTQISGRAVFTPTNARILRGHAEGSKAAKLLLNYWMYIIGSGEVGWWNNRDMTRYFKGWYQIEDVFSTFQVFADQ
jgi:hypothetical protein